MGRHFQQKVFKKRKIHRLSLISSVFDRNNSIEPATTSAKLMNSNLARRLHLVAPAAARWCWRGVFS